MQGEVIVTIPQVYWSSPGVLRHDYPKIEAPITPQVKGSIKCCFVNFPKSS